MIQKVVILIAMICLWFFLPLESREVRKLTDVEVYMTVERTSVLRVSEIQGRLMVRNISEAPITISSNGCFLQFVSFSLVDERGRDHASSDYGGIHAIFDKIVAEDIRPGSFLAANVSLALITDDKLAVPGKYRLQARFEYQEIKANSRIIEITIGDDAFKNR